MGYSGRVEIPGDDGTGPGYSMSNGYSSDGYVTGAGSVSLAADYTGNSSSHDAASAMLTYASHYAPATAMMTTVPYCAPLVGDPYIVQHGGTVGYTHQVKVQLLHTSADCFPNLFIYAKP